MLRKVVQSGPTLAETLRREYQAVNGIDLAKSFARGSTVPIEALPDGVALQKIMAMPRGPEKQAAVLASYGVAKLEVMPEVRHRTSR